MYYDEANSRPLDVDVFFVDIPISTQLMELVGGEGFFFFFCIDTNKNKYFTLNGR